MSFDSKLYIDHLAEELIKNFNYASNATTPVLIGSAREKEVIRKLELLLPNSVGIGSGCVIDSFGEVSKQMDIIIYEKEFCPVFCINDSPETTYYPCEGVIAAGEVKSTLTSKELENIFEKSKSVKKLIRHSELKKSGFPGFDKMHYPFRKYNSKTSFEGAQEENYDQKNKFLDQIFFFALCGSLELNPETLVERFDENLKLCNDNEEVNLVSILNNGLIFYRNKEQNSIVYLKKDASSFYFLKQEKENFQFLLHTIINYISSGRTVPVHSFNRYLGPNNNLYLMEGINGIDRNI